MKLSWYGRTYTFKRLVKAIGGMVKWGDWCEGYYSPAQGSIFVISTPVALNNFFYRAVHDRVNSDSRHWDPMQAIDLEAGRV